ncbi:acyl-CoA N-acyltransferase [Flagelloscypha sp. PMI_526]|nr:acyl-CoA N-acyltransferase [Flagelloscypha sp. PMI_526]
MPQLHHVQVEREELFVVKRPNGDEKHAYVLHRKPGYALVKYVEVELALIEDWIPDKDILRAVPEDQSPAEFVQGSSNGALANENHEVVMTEDVFDYEQHKKMASERNFENVYIGDYRIKTWYWSPYPFDKFSFDDSKKAEDTAKSKSTRGARSAGLSRKHGGGLTADLFKNSATNGSSGELPSLWVCHRCLTYTDYTEVDQQEMHITRCSRKHPPGKKVYERGTQTIWEVDGAHNKVYCTQLALLGKLFLETKTLYFECFTFDFYVLTEQLQAGEHNIIGYFSKEKLSLDNFNLSTIVVLPPYQKQGWGMLMIEFSYELSRRSQVIQAPETPLSILGQRGYMSFWAATIIRFFRRVLSPVEPPPLPLVGSDWDKPYPLMFDHRTKGLAELASLGSDGGKRTAKKSAKAKDGKNKDYPDGDNNVITNPKFSTQRDFHTYELTPGAPIVYIDIPTTLREIADACNIDVQTFLWTCNQIGLVTQAFYVNPETKIVLTTEVTTRTRKVRTAALDHNPEHIAVDDDAKSSYPELNGTPLPNLNGTGSGSTDHSVNDDATTSTTSPNFTPAPTSKHKTCRIARERRMKRPCIDLNCVLLDEVIPGNAPKSVRRVQQMQRAGIAAAAAATAGAGKVRSVEVEGDVTI